MNRFPIVLPNRQIQRIMEHGARLLILGRELSPGRQRSLGLYAVHNAKTERDNRRHRRAGRPDLQTDPHVLTIEPIAVRRLKLRDVDDKHARAAGYENAIELRDDWRDRRKRLDLDVIVYAHTFEVSDARYLHAEVHRGYTHDPAEALRDEGAALGPVELERYAKDARERDEVLRAAKRAEMPLEARVRDLHDRARKGDREAQRALHVIRQKLEQAESRRARQAA